MKVETMLEEKEKKGKTIETYSPIPIGLVAEAEDRRWSRGKTSTDEEQEKDEFQEKKRSRRKRRRGWTMAKKTDPRIEEEGENTVTPIAHCVCEINQTVTAIGMMEEESGSAKEEEDTKNA